MTARYDTIGTRYDTTRHADPFIVERLARRLAIRPGGAYLDVACGSGNYTSCLARAGGEITGVDISRRMIEHARAKTSEARWILATADALPFGAAQFDGALCTLAIHHFPDMTAAFAEIRRVIARGRFVLFTASREQMRGYWLNHYFPKAMDFAIRQMPDLPDVMNALSLAGFVDIEREAYAVTPDLQDLFLYAGKHRPALYLDPQVRAGISTFAMTSNIDEMTTGLRRLANDIETDAINSVRQAFDHDLGDYLFITAEARPAN
ncbi:MAG TPA: class I SAM-dependent methyltransferase [Phycisphaerae bacterium]|mgnify:CR=1 FL=1|nr:class I SAM-dependent methyltransferase [Phycisphaerae bacterium]HRW53099.1 class I SAM-dependent methyltransferase [Phycisphaerae bacterium]